MVFAYRGNVGLAQPTENVTGPSVPGGIRTPNLLIRSQKLYPVELQAHNQNPKHQGSKSKRWSSTSWSLGFGICGLRSWGGRRDSNPQQPEPQSGALPLSYGHHHCQGTRLKFEF